MSGIPRIQPYSLPTVDELPANVADWIAEPDRAVLLMHDLQRFFLRPFAGAEPLPGLLRNAARLRAAAVTAGMPIAYTAQPGGMTPEQRGLLRDFWGPGMAPEPADREVVAELAPSTGDWILTKWRYSAFHRSDLLDRIRSSGRDQLIVCGVYAHVGVLMTLADAFTHDIQAFLAADAVADFSAGYHRMALTYAAERCAVVQPTERITADLGALAVRA